MANSYDQINGWYNQYLGHSVGDQNNSGWATWANDPNAESNIKNSGEGLAYAQKQSPQSQPTVWQNGTPVGYSPDNLGPTNAANNTPGDLGYNPSQPSTQPAATNYSPITGYSGSTAPVTINSNPTSVGAGTQDTFLRWIQQASGANMVNGRTVGTNANQYRGNLQPVVDAYNKAFGANAKVSGADSIDFGNGLGPTDVITGDGNWWFGNSTPGQPGMSGQGADGQWHDGSTGTGGGGGGSSSSSSSSSSSGLVNDPNGQTQSLIDLLLGRAKQSLSIDPQTDSIIKPQLDAASAQNTRDSRNYLNNLAESSNPYATGANIAAGTQVAEKGAQANNALSSQLVQNELTSRRTEIQNALTEMGSLLTANQQMSLQKELAQIDAGLKQQQINSGNDQFAASLGLNTSNQNNYWDSVRSGLL